MAKLNTTQQNAAFWLAQADRYDREAARQLRAGSPINYRHWTDKADAARAKAAEVAQVLNSENDIPTKYGLGYMQGRGAA